MSDREPAAEIEEAWRPAQLSPEVNSDVDEPLDCEQALGRACELRADVNVQARDVEARGEGFPHGRDRVVGD